MLGVEIVGNAFRAFHEDEVGRSELAQHEVEPLSREAQCMRQSNLIQFFPGAEKDQNEKGLWIGEASPKADQVVLDIGFKRQARRPWRS